tara:strand:+ start:389 stop:598 length:210 start_codon:yes stop_codon:yes gene_type:complete
MKIHEHEEILLDCFFCNKSKHHEEVFGFIGFDKEDIEDVGLTDFFNKHPDILENDEVVCDDCLNKEVKQ